MSAFTPSPHQQALFDWVKTGRGSANVIAVAGSGKSTSLEKLLPNIPPTQTVLGLSFNASIAREWKEIRLPRLAREHPGRDFAKVQFRTFHSLGYGAVCRKLGVSPQQLPADGNKLRKICRGWLGEVEDDLYSTFCCKLVGLAKGEGIGAIVPDVDSRWWDLISHHDLYLDSDDADERRAVEIARELLQRSNDAAARDRLIDFDDQLYLPLLWKLRLSQNDWVLVDEEQDTNPTRRALAKLALRPGGRFLGVGDPNQAIYGFTGATHNAMDLVKSEFSCVELPLSVCYRCCTSVVEEARKYVDHILPAPGAPAGKVETLTLADALKVLDAHNAVLCRNTSPLVELAYTLISKGIGCTIAGRDIATGLVNLIKKQRARGIDGLLEKLDLYRDREQAKFIARGEEGKAEAVGDRVACITTVIDHLDENERTVPALIAKLEGMFSDGNGVLVLSTVHKAKGKEWRRVAILRPELMPSKWARQEHQQRQEVNLQYVAVTRAKEHLIYLEGA